MQVVQTGANDAHNAGPAHPLIERALSWLHATFPERQIYIRSDGRVQFFTFGASLQATLAGLALIFLGWVAFSTVNVIFKDRIIAAKDHRYQAMQSTYENRVASLQLSYDELNGALIAAEDKFKATANELQAKHDTLARLIGRKQSIDASLTGTGGNNAFAPTPLSLRGGDLSSRAASDSLDSGPVESFTPPVSVTPVAPPATNSTNNGSDLFMLPQPTDPQPRTSGPTRASLLDLGTSLYQFFHNALSPKHIVIPAHIANQPALRALAEQTARIEQISADDDNLLAATETRLASRANKIEKAIRVAGINPGAMESRATGRYGRSAAAAFRLPSRRHRRPDLPERISNRCRCGGAARCAGRRHAPCAADAADLRRGCRGNERFRPARRSLHGPRRVPCGNRFRRSVGLNRACDSAGHCRLGRTQGALRQYGRGRSRHGHSHALRAFDGGACGSRRPCQSRHAGRAIRIHRSFDRTACTLRSLAG